MNNVVQFIATKVPEDLIVNLNVIAAAPLSIRAAGICDVLSIATGAWDWRFAAERETNPPEMAYKRWVDQAAHTHT